MRLVLMMIAMIAASPVMAASVLPPTVPAARGTVLCSGPDPTELDNGTACQNGAAFAFYNLGSPTFASANETYPGGLSSEAYSTLAGVSYSVVVWAGAYGKAIPIKVDFSLQQETSDPNASARAFASITFSGPQGILGNGYKAICTLGCAGSGGDAIEYDGTLDLLVFSGFVYTVSLEADVSISPSILPSTASARADPYIYVDPTFPDAASYSILLSDGVGNSPAGVAAVPEPAGWMLLIAGFGLTGSAMRRKRLAEREMSDIDAARTARQNGGLSSSAIMKRRSRVFAAAVGLLMAAIGFGDPAHAAHILRTFDIHASDYQGSAGSPTDPVHLNFTLDFDNAFDASDTTAGLTINDYSLSGPLTYSYLKIVDELTIAPHTFLAGCSGLSCFFIRGVTSATPAVSAVMELNGFAATTSITFRDETITALPEPATWTMMIAGFGMIGLLLRRRHDITSAASA